MEDTLLPASFRVSHLTACELYLHVAVNICLYLLMPEAPTLGWCDELLMASDCMGHALSQAPWSWNRLLQPYTFVPACSRRYQGHKILIYMA